MALHAFLSHQRRFRFGSCRVKGPLPEREPHGDCCVLPIGVSPQIKLSNDVAKAAKRSAGRFFR
jgi:hypothetical protein